ncbi:exonuclease domain-containing protein [Peribacillus kribbensis]|uniref:exonuclease domain-containing protein n=1 Tax=Peribacillus kribbensis TaxID=356658 RepID=UPI00041E1FC8|nr:exonuclease domain-containing protein [Peribacillus kribbensis]
MLNKEQKLGLVVDVETTGLGPDRDEIIELALKLFSYHEETGEVLEIIEKDSFLREPLSFSARRNYGNAFRVHGIPYEMVEGKTFYEPKIKQYFERAETVFAHNASFDRSFLYRMYPEVNELKWFCTMRSVPWKKYGFPDSKLLTLLQAHGITDHQTHRALDDITYLMELLKQTNPDGTTYLKEIINARPMRRYQPSVQKSRTSGF